MDKIIRGDLISQMIKENCHNAFKQHYMACKRVASLSVIMVGNGAASMTYIKSKEKLCAYLGVKLDLHLLPEDIQQEDIILLVEKLNNDHNIDGIFIQMPLPKHIDEYEVIFKLDYKKDVDGLHPMNLGNLVLRKNTFIPCTPNGVMYLLKQLPIELSGKKAVVVGRSILVGKPMAQLLEQENCTVTLCHSHTTNLEEECNRADILIVGIGKAKMINQAYVKTGAVVIDIGINHTSENQLVGDVDLDNVIDIVSYITPVPKGVGAMTVAMLACNILKAYESHIGE